MKKIISMTLFSDPRCQGGVETFNRTLKSFFNDKLTIITQANKNRKLYDIDVIEIGSNNFLFRILNKFLNNKIREKLVLKVLNKLEKEVIILSYPYEAYILKKLKVKKILVQHINYSKFISSYCENNEKYIKTIKKNIDYLVTLSEFDKLKFQTELNFDSKKIKVIRHSCNMELLKGKKNKINKLIMIARIDNFQKRFDLAIKAMKNLPEFELEIYGDIYRKKDLENLKKILLEEKLDNVKIYDATNQVKEKLDKAGIYIMTSDYEAYGIINIEAMRRGLPIVLRNTFEAAQDIVVNNQNGILLDREWNEEKFVEAVRKIYKNYEYYSENAKILGERYNPELIKKEWDNLFEEIDYGK